MEDRIVIIPLAYPITNSRGKVRSEIEIHAGQVIRISYPHLYHINLDLHAPCTHHARICTHFHAPARTMHVPARTSTHHARMSTHMHVHARTMYTWWIDSYSDTQVKSARRHFLIIVMLPGTD